MPGRMLGRRPPKNAPALMLGPALTGVVPEHPAAVDHFSEVGRWFLGANNRFGTCGPTDLANFTKLVYRYLLGEDITVTDEAIFDLYRRSGNPHFDPATGADDNGVDMQTMLEAFTSGGLDVVRSDGRAENVRPVAFAKVDVSNLDEVRAAISIFGGANLGLDLEVAQQTQADNGGPWDHVPSAQWGGHAVLAGRYRAVRDIPDRGSLVARGFHVDDRTGAVTWAELIDMTDAFLERQLGEAWVVVLPAHLAHPDFQRGVDLAAFAAAYEALTHRPFPVPVPAPVPTPGPDPADLALVVALDGWAHQHHRGGNAMAARAYLTWKANRRL
jgi:hypothetical protein